MRAGAVDDPVHARGGLRGNPTNVEGNKSAQAANFAQHGTALDDIGPHSAAVNRRGCGLEAGQSQRHASNDNYGDGDVDDPLDLFLASV